MEFELYKDTNTIWDEHETRDINCGFQNINNLNSFVKNKSKVTNIKLIILGFENDTFFKKLNTTQIENLNSYGLKTFDITSEIRDYLNNKLIKN